MIVAPLAHAQTSPIKIAVHASLTGSGGFSGKALVDGVQFAVEEANEASGNHLFEVAAYDDDSQEAKAVDTAHKVIASDAAVVIGPSLSPLALAACPSYGDAGMPVVIGTVHADDVTKCATTFRIVVSTGEIGDAIGNYLGRVFGSKRAIVISKDNGYGRPLAARFKQVAERLGIASDYYTFANAAQRDTVVAQVANLVTGQQNPPPIILGMTYEDVVSVMTALRRHGFTGLFLGTATMARASFVNFFKDEPEERRKRGFFTANAYAVSPMILDSASADVLAFAGRYRARFGSDPSWESVQAYDSAKLAMAAAQASAAAGPDLGARRKAALTYLKGLNSPANAIAGLTGPMWFTPGRIRPEAVRMGRFHDGVYESAPLQIVPVPHPEASEITSGAVFATDGSKYARLQRVVQTGMYINEISRIDLLSSSFIADFYLWLRYAKDAGPDSADPTDITFPNLISGKFDHAHPVEQASLPDGTQYRLWRVQGEFRNDFDLHRFPFDQQNLLLDFSNTRASTDGIVYVIDRRDSGRREASGVTTTATADSFGLIAAAAATAKSDPAAFASTLLSPVAFRNLTQWEPRAATELRDDVVSPSALGDLRRVAVESVRELSGFMVRIAVQRRAIATLVKSLLPLFIMTLIMLAALYFPHGLVKEEITVPITAVLSGAVLLGAINAQLGGIGYTMAIEYVFFVFFGLGLLSIVSVLIAERFRVAGHRDIAARAEGWSRAIFYLCAVAIGIAAWVWLRSAPGA
jgi:ABC-type branched-subunit amino acid transport system substrate-binding protein